MESITFEAVYEAGVLRPLTPVAALREQAKLRVTVEPADKPVVKRPIPQMQRSTHPPVDHSKTAAWMKAHRDEYRGQWVVLDGDRLVGHAVKAEDIDDVVTQARAEGVHSPFITQIRLDDEPIWMGWL